MFDLRRRLIWSETKSFGLEDQAIAERAEVLPSESGCNRFAGGAIPHNGRCPLVCDTNSSNGPTIGECCLCCRKGCCGHSSCVEFNEPGRRRVRQNFLTMFHRDCRIGSNDCGTNPRSTDIDDKDAHFVRAPRETATIAPIVPSDAKTKAKRMIPRSSTTGLETFRVAMR